MHWQISLLAFIFTYNRAQLSLYTGMCFTLLIGFSNGAVMVPSMIVTYLMFRSGAIRSLHDPYFKNYRRGLSTVTYLFGASIWATIFSLFFTIVFAFAITFLFAYQVSYMQRFVFLILFSTFKLILISSILGDERIYAILFVATYW